MPRKKKVEEVKEIKIGDIIKVTNDIFLRSEKDIIAPICQKLRKGSVIKIIRISDEWFLVKYNTIYGYIPKSYIT